MKERQVEIRAYVKGRVTKDDAERMSCIAGEVIADFPEGYTIAESCVSVDTEDEKMLDFWAFRRTSETNAWQF